MTDVLSVSLSFRPAVRMFNGLMVEVAVVATDGCDSMGSFSQRLAELLPLQNIHSVIIRDSYRGLNSMLL